MLCKCHWIVLYTVHVTAFVKGAVFPNKVYYTHLEKPFDKISNKRLFRN